MHCKPPCYWYKTFYSFPNYNDSRSLTTYCSIVVHAKFFHVANAIIFIIVFSNCAIDFIIGEKTRHHTSIIYCCKWMIMSMMIVHIAPLFSWQKTYMKCKLTILHIQVPFFAIVMMMVHLEPMLIAMDDNNPFVQTTQELHDNVLW